MEYKLVTDSPVQKEVQVTAGPDEVNAAIAAGVAEYSQKAQLDGYRKGKAPANLIEKRFHDAIYDEAKDNLLNVHINQIMTDHQLIPVSGIKMRDADVPLEKNKPFEYSLSFEVMPKFDLPNYEGLEVEEEKTEMDEKELEQVFNRLCREYAKLVPAEGNGPAHDGQVVNIDFEAFENGEPIKDFSASDFNLHLDNNEALPEFEKLVKGIPVGHTGEGTIAFPKDFIAPTIAGKTLNMKVHVNALKELELPELNDEFAKSIGFNSMEHLKELISKSYLKSSRDLHKGVAQRKLLNHMLKQTDFPLPPSMVDVEINFLLANEAERLERHGKSIKSLGKSGEELKEAVRPRAEEMTRDKILLLSIARDAKLDITPQEVEKNIYANCVMHGENYQDVLSNLEKSGLMFHLRDQMLCDKAMDMVYDRAKVTFVEPEAMAKRGETDGSAAASTSTAAQETPADQKTEAGQPSTLKVGEQAFHKQ